MKLDNIASYLPTLMSVRRLKMAKLNTVDNLLKKLVLTKLKFALPSPVIRAKVFVNAVMVVTWLVDTLLTKVKLLVL